MGKQIAFTNQDKDLIEKIQVYQKEQNIKSFVEAVRQLCRSGLSKNVNVKINVEQ